MRRHETQTVTAVALTWDVADAGDAEGGGAEKQEEPGAPVMP